MEVFLVYIGDILHCPPAISIIHALDSKNAQVHVCIPKLMDKNYKKYFYVSDKVNFFEVSDVYEKDRKVVSKQFDLLCVRKKLWNYINKYKNKNSIIWVLSSGSIKYLGKKLLNENYVLHLLELTEELYYLESRHLFRLTREYVKKAKVLIECEYNRSHITKAWWGLSYLPTVLPNKPYPERINERNAEITSSIEVRKLLNNLNGKKIILYQGNMSKERPIDLFIKAVGELGSDFAFIAMTNSDNPYPDIHVDNYYHIPFIAPPYHLEVTSHSYIGILSYVPIKNDYSILNTLYCAPNKTWEYSKFGIPMISNDLPALQMIFTKYKNGICVETITVETIKMAISEIDKNYKNYAENSLNYYESIDVCDIVGGVLDLCSSY